MVNEYQDHPRSGLFVVSLSLILCLKDDSQNRLFIENNKRKFCFTQMICVHLIIDARAYVNILFSPSRFVEYFFCLKSDGF